MQAYFTDAEGYTYAYDDKRLDPSYQELFKAYQPTKTMLTGVVKELKRRRAHILKLKDESQTRLAAQVPYAKLEMAMAIVSGVTYTPEIERIDELLDMNTALLRMHTHKSRAAEVIAIPMTDFLQFNREGFARCPFHNDKGPSFKYYRRDNRAHCFSGCGQKNVIQVYAQLKGIDTKQAFRELLKTLS